MTKQSFSFRQRVRSFRIMAVCWAAFMIGGYFLSCKYLKVAFGWIILAIPWTVFLCVKAMGLKCPKCQKTIDLRAVSKFCPHCGKPLE